MDSRRFISILIVDDSVVFLDSLEKLLADLGFTTVEKSTSAEDALSLINKRSTDSTLMDLIICDQHMGEMSGLDLLKNIRKIKKKEELPFFLLTSDASRSNIIRLTKNGGNNFLVKPLNKEVLLEKIQTVFAV